MNLCSSSLASTFIIREETIQKQLLLFINGENMKTRRPEKHSPSSCIKKVTNMIKGTNFRNSAKFDERK